jgi:hypothetical protein
MRLFSLGVCALVMLAAQAAMGQQANRVRAANDHAGQQVIASSGVVQATPEMWFYEQYRQERGDKVEQSASFRATQRRHRLASRRWFGLSNARPRANSDPVHGDYSPHWTGNNTLFPDRWAGQGGGWIVSRAAD